MESYSKIESLRHVLFGEPYFWPQTKNIIIFVLDYGLLIIKLYLDKITQIIFFLFWIQD